MIKLYDLALANEDVRPSPYCWKVKFALMHKGLEFETVPLRFAEKDNYPDREHGMLPVIEDREQIICDSNNIVAWLEKNFPDKPLTETSGERAAVEFYNAWLTSDLMPILAPLLWVRIHAAAHDDDKNHYRTTREKRLGSTLEEAAAKPGLKAEAEAAFKTLAMPLAGFRFLGGDTPNLSDYTVFSFVMWMRSVVSDDFLDLPQPVVAWIERMLDLFDGYAREAVRAL
ncbi:glutathione S-transferase N-terminal domain-containing protein [Hyphococcus sp. DH-69]|uniref:glutathione S-transferase N-terminal domain-containing protein n=1 Tax=Hyphococcus formosus TaxID=3143534 RepID=UPI00398B309D